MRLVFFCKFGDTPHFPTQLSSTIELWFGLGSAVVKIKNNIDAVFMGPMGFCTKFSHINDFCARRASYRFKAYELRNWRAFEFFQLLKKNII